MNRLEVNPLYRDWLAQQGLSQAEDFLRLSGVIWCGHPDRNVAHLTLGAGESSMSVFLKKEHRIPFRDRLNNALAGFGLVPRSLREANFLRTISRAGIGSPEFIAAGEFNQRAFLLVREIDDAVDLRSFLAHEKDAATRRKLARQIGVTIAEMHKRGIVHGDLFSKHVLVHFDAQGNSTLAFLDWQRARKTRFAWPRCFQELAQLDATLVENLCSERDRLVCLRAYLRCLGGKQKLGAAAAAIRTLSEALQRKRYVREMRQVPLEPGQQNLIWLDGEAMCVTRQFMEATGSLPSAHAGEASGIMRQRTDDCGALRALHDLQSQAPVQCQQIVRIDERKRLDAVLVRRQESRFWSWLWRSLRRRNFTSKELSLAAALFRLERYGVPVPKLLAVGQQFPLPWQVRSFILLEHASLPSLPEWRKANRDSERDRTVLAQSAMHLHRIHEAGYFVAKSRDPLEIFAVSTDDNNKQQVVLRDPAALRRTGKG